MVIFHPDLVNGLFQRFIAENAAINNGEFTLPILNENGELQAQSFPQDTKINVILASSDDINAIPQFTSGDTAFSIVPTENGINMVLFASPMEKMGVRGSYVTDIIYNIYTMMEVLITINTNELCNGELSRRNRDTTWIYTLNTTAMEYMKDNLAPSDSQIRSIFTFYNFDRVNITPSSEYSVILGDESVDQWPENMLSVARARLNN